MNILAIETSCDETAAAVVKDDREVLSNVVASQIDIHAKYGGVVPEVAARAHVQAIIPVVEESLSEAKINWEDVDAIAVTQGPGLVGSLIVGTETARTLAILKNKALIAVNHLEGHVYANWIVGEISNDQFPRLRNAPNGQAISNQIPNDKISKRIDSGQARMTKNQHTEYNIQHTVPQFPLIALLVSGGHTLLIYMPEHYNFQIVGQTRDDAAGEAFDKVAALLSLPYPGGPNISKLAEKASSRHSREGGKPEERFKLPVVDLTPEPKRNKEGFLEYPEPSLDFSFSGLKTAVLNVVKSYPSVIPDSKNCHSREGGNLSRKKLDSRLPPRLSEAGRGNDKASIAASFQKTLVDTLVQNSGRAIKKYKPSSFLLSGGVAANPLLRQQLQKMCSKADIEFHMPELKYCTDNAAMIGVAAFYKQKKFGFTEPKTLEPAPTLKL